MTGNSFGDGGPIPEHLNTGPSHNLPDGFPFSPDSYIRKFTEPSTFLMYPYIAGMTVMDDRIAAAVNTHSAFREQPWRRLFSTVDSAMVLVFGSEEETMQTAERMYSFHQTVRGSDEGVTYNANDADAQTWVLASVFNGLKEAKRRWAPPALNKEQEQGLYEDIRIFGQFFGIDSAVQPEDVGDLDAYWERRISEGELLKTEVGIKMAQTVFRFSESEIPSALARLGRVLSMASLDPRLREQADLHPSQSDERIAGAFDKVMRSTYGRIPASRREQVIPAYMYTRRQLIAAVGKFSSLRVEKASN